MAEVPGSLGMTQQHHKRPIGLWIIGLIQLVPSILSVFVVSVILLAIPLQRDQRVITLLGTFLFLWVFSGVSAWVSWAFLQLRWWARIGMIIVVVTAAIYPALLPFYRAAHGTGWWLWLVPRLLYAAWVVWYLRRAPLRVLFASAPATTKHLAAESLTASGVTTGTVQ